ncbi:Fc.00g116000.m01.CDS01 [Cosmosporella sp. VM-42]
MRSLTLLAALMGSAMAFPFSVNHLTTRKTNSKGFTIATPGGVDDVIITSDNTLNGTVDNSKQHRGSGTPTPGSLDLALVNNFGDGVKAYIQGTDTNDAVVFIGADGTTIYPTAAGSGTPVEITEPIAIALGAQGSTTNIKIPIVMSSGRVYFSAGDLHFFIVAIDSGDGIVQPSIANPSDPSAGLNWGFVELTYTKELAIWANISYVDFVGMILSMLLENTDGSKQETIGLDAGAVTEVCNGLKEQGGKDGMPWPAMCVAGADGTPLRAVSPQNLGDQGAFQSYWTKYVDDVWAKYTNEALTINTQNEGGAVKCQVSGDQLNCDGDNRGYAKPNALDIWGCNSGPFAIQKDDNSIHLAVVPRLCAAFVRTTLLLAGGESQPSLDSSNYYTQDPTNHYGRLIHAHEVDGRGYAFPYDDVNPSGNEDASGLVSSGNPKLLTVFVGGKGSS